MGPNDATNGQDLDWRDHVVCDPGILGGEPTLRGTRLAVEFVLELLAGGWDREAIRQNYPNLTDEHIRAVMAYAIETVRQRAKPIGSAIPDSCGPGLAGFRLATGTELTGIPHLTYMLQLMACLEAIHSGIRWGMRLERSSQPAVVDKLDVIAILFACVGWCAEAFRLVKEGAKSGAVSRVMLTGKQDQEALWDQILAKEADQIIRTVHRIRDKYFGHFDPQIMNKFVEWQEKSGRRELFFLGTEVGKPLDCRFTWPMAACLFDLHGDPASGDCGEGVGELRDSLYRILEETGNMLQTLVESWLANSGLQWEVID